MDKYQDSDFDHHELFFFVSRLKQPIIYFGMRKNNRNKQMPLFAKEIQEHKYVDPRKKVN